MLGTIRPRRPEQTRMNARMSKGSSVHPFNSCSLDPVGSQDLDSLLRLQGAYALENLLGAGLKQFSGSESKS